MSGKRDIRRGISVIGGALYLKNRVVVMEE